MLIEHHNSDHGRDDEAHRDPRLRQEQRQQAHRHQVQTEPDEQQNQRRDGRWVPEHPHQDQGVQTSGRRHPTGRLRLQNGSHPVEDSGHERAAQPDDHCQRLRATAGSRIGIGQGATRAKSEIHTRQDVVRDVAQRQPHDERVRARELHQQDGVADQPPCGEEQVGAAQQQGAGRIDVLDWHEYQQRAHHEDRRQRATGSAPSPPHRRRSRSNNWGTQGSSGRRSWRPPGRTGSWTRATEARPGLPPRFPSGGNRRSTSSTTGAKTYVM